MEYLKKKYEKLSLDKTEIDPKSLIKKYEKEYPQLLEEIFLEVIKGEIEHHTNIQKNPDNIYPENEVIIKKKKVKMDM